MSLKCLSFVPCGDFEILILCYCKEMGKWYTQLISKNWWAFLLPEERRQSVCHTNQRNHVPILAVPTWRTRGTAQSTNAWKISCTTSTNGIQTTKGSTERNGRRSEHVTFRAIRSVSCVYWKERWFQSNRYITRYRWLRVEHTILTTWSHCVSRVTQRYMPNVVTGGTTGSPGGGSDLKNIPPWGIGCRLSRTRTAKLAG